MERQCTDQWKALYSIETVPQGTSYGTSGGENMFLKQIIHNNNIFSSALSYLKGLRNENIWPLNI